MNRFQANLCLICVTLCWASEVVIYACIPEGVSEFATMCVSSFMGTALLLVPFWRRVVDTVRKSGWRFLASMLLIAVLSVVYNQHFIAGLRSFDVVEGAFAYCLTVITTPFVMLVMRRRIPLWTWISVAIVSAGILLVLVPSLCAANAMGLVVILVGSVLCSVVTVLLVDLVRKYDPLAVASVREGFVAAIALGTWYFVDHRLFAGVPASKTLFAAWAVYTYFIVVLALVLNVFAMRRVSAANATVVYSLQVVFSLALGVLLPAGVVDHVELTPRVLVGAALVVVGSLVEIFDFGGKKKESEE